MNKNFLVFSNGEKIGDAIIKLPLIYEIKKRFPDYRLIWLTNKEETAYNKQLKNLASLYIDEIIEKVDLNPFFWQKISNTYNFENKSYEYIFDTQKTIYRTLALRRIRCKKFISAAGNGFFSSYKINKNPHNFRKYYLEDLFDLLNIIKFRKTDQRFRIPIPNILEKQLSNIFNNKNKYIGIAPGAGEKDRIWPLRKFIEVGKYFEKKNYQIVFYLGPNEVKIKNQLVNLFPNSIIPEDKIKKYSNIEIVISSTKFLSCAIANDSGIGHMLSSGYCPLIKLFGHKDSNKFTPINDKIITLNSKEYGGNDISLIPLDSVIENINKMINI